MRNEHFEIPFIAFYRKEYVEPDLNINDLWIVYKWDEKWCQLNSRKNSVAQLLENMQHYLCDDVRKEKGEPIIDGIRPLLSSDIQRLKEAQSPDEVSDACAHFRLHYGQYVSEMKKSLLVTDVNLKDDDQALELVRKTKFKHSVRRTAYMFCKEAGIGKLAKMYGLTPDQFAENLRDNYQRHKVVQCPIGPIEAAKDFICLKFRTAEEVLNAVQHIVATEIASEPTVRKCFGQAYFEKAKVTVRPTKMGIKEINEAHPCFTLKYISNKPVGDFQDDQFLKLTMAERSKLLTFTISFDVQAYLGEIKQLYEKDEFSKNVKDWNDQRVQALKSALSKLNATFEKKLKMCLLSEAEEGIIKMCSQKLHNWLKVAPYTADSEVQEDENFNTRDGIRVLSIAYIPSRETPAFCALVNGDGQVNHYLRLPFLLSSRNAGNRKEKLQKEESLNLLRNIILDKKPHVVAIGAQSREAMMIVDDVKVIINELMTTEQLPRIPIELIDNELSLLYMNSKNAKEDFPDYPPLLRQAVSIARRLQDPLVEFSQLWSPDDDILRLKYHPLQGDVGEDKLLNELHLEFINRTNEVGVNINQAIEYAHVSNLVQFVCGLGPRKGNGLIKALKTMPMRISNRSELVTACHMGPNIYINCAGFFKIETSLVIDEDSIDILDGSRVHPEAYEWARKMAIDALDYDNSSEDIIAADALNAILENPDKLKDLDLDAFAEELQRQNFGNKGITLYDIRAELNCKYKDLRTPYHSPNAEVLFNLLTKEIPETFYIGKLVLATVVEIVRIELKDDDELENFKPVRDVNSALWKCQLCLKDNYLKESEVWKHLCAGNCPGKAMGIRVRLDNGISGFVPLVKISDNRVINPEDRVQIGMPINCRITKIDVERFSVVLTSRSSDLLDENNYWRPAKDIYYDFEAERFCRSAENEKKSDIQVYVKRNIFHPSFLNITYADSEQLLKNKDIGEVIVRPSSKPYTPSQAVTAHLATSPAFPDLSEAPTPTYGATPTTTHVESQVTQASPTYADTPPMPQVQSATPQTSWV